MSHSPPRRVMENLVPLLLCLTVGFVWAWNTKDLRDKNRELTRQTEELKREHSRLTAKLDRLQEIRPIVMENPPPLAD